MQVVGKDSENDGDDERGNEDGKTDDVERQSRIFGGFDGLATHGCNVDRRVQKRGVRCW